MCLGLCCNFFVFFCVTLCHFAFTLNLAQFRNNLNFYYFNARSLLAISDYGIPRTDLLQAFCNIEQTVDLVAITETHLDATIGEDELNIDDFTLFRNDRLRGGRHGGGVLLYVRDTLQPTIIAINNNEIESLFVLINNG